MLQSLLGMLLLLLPTHKVLLGLVLKLLRESASVLGSFATKAVPTMASKVKQWDNQSRRRCFLWHVIFLSLTGVILDLHS